MVHFLFLIVLLLAGCSKVDPAALEEAEARRASLEMQLELKTAEVEQYEATVARLENEIAEMLDRQSSLESQVEVLRLKEDSVGELAQCVEQRAACLEQMSENAELMAGVLKADQEARQRQYQRQIRKTFDDIMGSASTTRSPPSTSPRGTAPKDSYVFVRQPYVTVGDGEVSVQGTINNTNDAPIDGFLRVELVSGGRVVGSETLHMTLAGNTVDGWETTFRGVVTIGGASFQARAEWDKER